jgi:hypothetical protein
LIGLLIRAARMMVSPEDVRVSGPDDSSDRTPLTGSGGVGDCACTPAVADTSHISESAALNDQNVNGR